MLLPELRSTEHRATSTVKRSQKVHVCLVPALLLLDDDDADDDDNDDEADDEAEAKWCLPRTAVFLVLLSTYRASKWGRRWGYNSRTV